MGCVQAEKVEQDFGTLPVSILANIFNFLSAKEVFCSTTLVCKNWKSASLCPLSEPWRQQVNSEFGVDAIRIHLPEVIEEEWGHGHPSLAKLYKSLYFKLAIEQVRSRRHLLARETEPLYDALIAIATTQLEGSVDGSLNAASGSAYAAVLEEVRQCEARLQELSRKLECLALCVR